MSAFTFFVHVLYFLFSLFSLLVSQLERDQIGAKCWNNTHIFSLC